MVEAMLLLRDKKKWEGLGKQAFQAMPRVGEYIAMNDENGVGRIYEVVAVIHGAAPCSTAGEIYIRYAGTELEVMRRLHDSHAP